MRTDKKHSRINAEAVTKTVVHEMSFTCPLSLAIYERSEALRTTSGAVMGKTVSGM